MSRPDSAPTDFDAVIVGGGFAGLNALYRLREHGLTVRLLESAGGVGGTWYWNRYPGARVDIESLEYSYAFSDSIQQRWRWRERFSAQPDVLSYLEWVAGQLDLYRDMQFDTRVESVTLDEASATWTLTTAQGPTLRCRFCIMAVGFLSATYWPDIPGLQNFSGGLIHTGAWPHDQPTLAGRRVGVIGAGATTVQLVPSIAPQVGHLTVFQRTPNWCFPMNNMPMPADYEDYVKSIYADVRRFEHQYRGPGAVLVGFDIRAPAERHTFDVSAEERERIFEAFWSDCALHLPTAFSDLLVNPQANRTLQDFLERKIRDIVKDPATAELLIPHGHPPFTRRPCGEHGYYEAFNRDNVDLVDALSDPIAGANEHGVVLESGRRFELDTIICATGFDAGTGGLTRMDIRGRGAEQLRDHWAGGARTYLGLMSNRFPNLFFLNAVQSPSAFFSPPLLGDYQSCYLLRLIEAAKSAGVRSIEPTAAAEAQWVTHVDEVVANTLMSKANSWWMGANIPGKPRRVVAYAGGFPEYARRAEIGLEALQDFELSN